MVLFCIGFFTVVGDIFHLKWSIWWYDIPLHFLGGSLVAMSVVLLWHFLYLNTVHKNAIVLTAVFSALTVGIVWEIYELYFGITSLSDGWYYYFDTIKDLVVDVCGAVLASVYSLKLISR